MKWKIGAALMALVFVVGMIPVVLSAGSSGSLTSVLSGDHEIVMQVDDKRALLDGKEVTLVDDAGSATPPRRDESGAVVVPIGVMSEALQIEVEWDAAGKVATLTRDWTTATLTIDSNEMAVTQKDVTTSVVLPCAVTTSDWAVYVPVETVAEMMGCSVKILPAVEGDLIVLSTESEGPDEKALAKLTEKALALCGPTYEMVEKNALIVRKGSAHAIVNGETVELEAAVLASGEVAEGAPAGLWLPVSAASQLTGETVSYNESKQRLEGANSKVDVTVYSVDEVPYCQVALLAEAAGANMSLIGQYTVGVLTPYDWQNDAAIAERLVASANALPDVLPPIPEAEHYIALTFDDGPTGGEDGVTMRLLDGLKERNAHATFFLCGYRIKDFNVMMDRYLAEGHELGNHTMDHKNLTKLSKSEVREQVDSNNDLIESYAGQPATVMRCVGGASNDTVKAAMKESGMPMIQWSVDTEDWKYRDADHICDVIVNEAKDGDIVLMHDLRECTLEGVLRAIDILSERGYAFVTVSELAQIKGVELEPGVMYNNFRDS
ncbi:MAG: polysaccharide deacetylase family protein [Butyricicoccus sp.]